VRAAPLSCPESAQPETMSVPNPGNLNKWSRTGRRQERQSDRFSSYVRRDREIQGCMQRLVVIHTRANSVEKKNLSHHQSVSDR
jgi:hypothetical protein